MLTDFIKRLKELLAQSNRIVIFPHKNPDGDALGSTLALSLFLQKKGYDCTIISPNEYPSFLNWMPGQKQIMKFTKEENKCIEMINTADLFFTLDFNSLGRIAPLDVWLNKQSDPIVMIDHHQAPEQYGHLQYSDPKIGSTCEMIFNVLEQLDRSCIDQEIATCIYTGIMTDSGSFRFSSTTSSTHRIIANLLDLGIDHTLIHQHIQDSYRFERLQLLGIALGNMTRIEDLQAVYTHLSQDELDHCDFQKGDTEGFVNYGLSLQGIKMAVILIENKQEKIIKMSFRSKGDFDVNLFARSHFNGGGHINAAGGVSSDSLQETIQNLQQAVLKYHNQLQ